MNGCACCSPVKTLKIKERLGKVGACESAERMKHSTTERTASKKYDQVVERRNYPDQLFCLEVH